VRGLGPTSLSVERLRKVFASSYRGIGILALIGSTGSNATFYIDIDPLNTIIWSSSEMPYQEGRNGVQSEGHH
jgi:hypothetical protein